MHTLASMYLGARFYAHMAHNLCNGPTFFADHDYLGSLYEAYDDAYDALIERMIGLGEEIDIGEITIEGADLFAKNSGGSNYFNRLLAMEVEICAEIKSTVAGKTDGTQNLLQDLADQSEARQYKLKQRTKR